MSSSPRGSHGRGSDVDGFGTSSGIFFRTSAALDPASLPTLSESVAGTSSVQLLGVDEAAPDYLVRYPVSERFAAAPRPYGAPNLLSVVPLRGVPLPPKSRYAVVLTRALRDAAGAPLATAAAVVQLSAGNAPPGMSSAALDAHGAALLALESAGMARSDVAAITVFTTGSPTETLGTAIATARATAAPAPNAPFTLTDEFPSSCVYATTVDMPVYQPGEPPFSEEGGGFALDEAGQPVLQAKERARFVLTVPRATMPAAGFPLVVFSRTGAGCDRPIVDRGVHAEPGGEAVTPGSGPALEFARAGFAGASIDGPHGGLRNVTKSDEQLLVFNLKNPVAVRDNVRQSALELALVPDILEGVQLDVAGCAGASASGAIAKFDTDTLAIMGHSVGATIAPLALVFEPRYKVAVGKRARRSAHLWPVRRAGAHHTGLPRHVLMMQGVVDHYIMPPIANAASLSFGLDLAGAALDAAKPELVSLTPLEALLPLVGRGSIALPAAHNATSTDGTPATAVVTHTLEDGIEDGHEVVFQTETPKHAYACFLAGPANGAHRAAARQGRRRWRLAVAVRSSHGGPRSRIWA